MPSFRALSGSPAPLLVATVLVAGSSLGCGRVGFNPIPERGGNKCVPSASRDTTCDGVDDDCDGKKDEDFKERSSSCGVGACEGNTGTVTCEDGRPNNSCDPMAGAQDDDQCDGVDNDCDGEVDEGFTRMATTCGVGVCSGNVGEVTCASGGLRMDSCDPLDGAGGDETTCDGIDNDCDGEVDEDYVPTQTFCGVGLCSGNTGELTCGVGGALLDTCDPLQGAAADDTTDDDLDDDCDGEIDEDVTCATSSLTMTFGAGARTIAVPEGCTSVSVRLWGGAGSTAGDGGHWGLGLARGDGGPGGYAAGVVAVDAVPNLTLYVGGGASSCDATGANPGDASYDGGAGGVSRGEGGAPGEDRVVAGGGIGGAPGGVLPGGAGGRGYYGGGGGGAGNSPGYPYGGGGSGGAASVLIFDGGRIVAGGGGGGGGMGANLVTSGGQNGGDGGSGCGVDGEVDSAYGGGGGGGGTCEVVGAASPEMETGTGILPYDPAGDLPPGAAMGAVGEGDTNCLPGGDGYAILTFSP